MARQRSHVPATQRPARRRPASQNAKLRFFGDSTLDQHRERAKRALLFLVVDETITLDVEELHSYLGHTSSFVQTRFLWKVENSLRVDVGDNGAAPRCLPPCADPSHHHVLDLGLFVEQLPADGIAPFLQEAMVKTVYKCMGPNTNIVNYAGFAGHWGNSANSMKTQWTAYLRTFGVASPHKEGQTVVQYDAKKVFGYGALSDDYRLYVDVGALRISRVASPGAFDPSWTPEEPTGWLLAESPPALTVDTSPISNQSASYSDSSATDLNFLAQEFAAILPNTDPRLVAPSNGQQYFLPASVPEQSSSAVPFPDFDLGPVVADPFANDPFIWEPLSDPFLIADLPMPDSFRDDPYNANTAFDFSAIPQLLLPSQIVASNARSVPPTASPSYLAPYEAFLSSPAPFAPTPSDSHPYEAESSYSNSSPAGISYSDTLEASLPYPNTYEAGPSYSSPPVANPSYSGFFEAQSFFSDSVEAGPSNPTIYEAQPSYPDPPVANPFSFPEEVAPAPLAELSYDDLLAEPTELEDESFWTQQ